MTLLKITPESLSMNCDLKCDMCDESVNYGDDYIAHLQIAHGISKNINYFMDKALNEITNRKTENDNVTLEEESNQGGYDPGNGNESDPYVIDEETKRNIEKTVEKTMGDLFKNIRLMVDGEMPIDLDDGNDEDLDVEDATEEKIWESFEKLKEIVNNMEFPPELLEELSGKNEESEANKEKVKEPVAKKRIAVDSPAQEKEKVQKFPRPQSSISIGRVANERGWSSQLLG